MWYLFRALAKIILGKMDSFSAEANCTRRRKRTFLWARLYVFICVFFWGGGMVRLHRTQIKCPWLNSI